VGFAQKSLVMSREFMCKAGRVSRSQVAPDTAPLTAHEFEQWDRILSELRSRGERIEGDQLIWNRACRVELYPFLHRVAGDFSRVPISVVSL
jgi:hypothetical protein